MFHYQKKPESGHHRLGGACGLLAAQALGFFEGFVDQAHGGEKGKAEG